MKWNIETIYHTTILSWNKSQQTNAIWDNIRNMRQTGTTK